MDLSIIIVNYNVYDDVIECINSIYKHIKNISFEIIVIDNNSTDKKILKLNDVHKEVVLLAIDTNYGFGHANNVGMSIAKGNFFLLVNPDILFSDNCIEILHKFMSENSKIAVAGPVQLKPNKGFEYYYAFFPTLYSRIMQEFGLYMRGPLMKRRFFDFWNENIKKGDPFKVDWVMGSCMMVRKEIYDGLGGFDEAFFLYEEETEWQYRMSKAGWLSFIIPDCKVLHNHHSSSSKIGRMFILYNEFRSRIIFSAKKYSFPVIIVRKILTINAIVFRFTAFTVINFISFDILKKRFYLYMDLIKLLFMSKKALLKTRFVFDDYKAYFLNTGNAKL